MVMLKPKQTTQETSDDPSFVQYYEAALWRCRSSPIGAHHWLIDDHGLGQCKYCRERRLFAKAAVADSEYHGDIECGQHQVAGRIPERAAALSYSLSYDDKC